jgi:uncharacterized surface protein with fasciclin (FAS1) repeats
MSPKFIAALAVGLYLSVAVATVATAQMSMAKTENTVQVGGAPMYPSRTIVQNAIHSKDHTTLVNAVKAAGLVETLSSPGPFTVFAPTNAAFGKLPMGAVDSLVKPENKGALTKVLTYHVAPGRLSATDLQSRATLRTVQGETLKVTARNGAVWLTDAKGGMSKVTIPNVYQSNGVIHVVDTVLMP